MAAAAELASIVAVYLRKHGFSKTLAAFSREIGHTPEDKDIVDLETLYKLHISTQVNGNTKTKNSKKTKLEEMLEMAKGNEDVRDNAEEKMHGGASSERKKKRKEEKENLVDSPMVAETEAKNIPKEEGAKKKRKEGKPNETIEGLKSKAENCLPVAGTLKPEETLSSRHTGHDSALNNIVVGSCVDNGGGLAIQGEVAHPSKSLHKRSKKEKKEQGGEQLAGRETLVSIETRLADNTQVSPQEDGLSKKKSKKSKDGGGAGGEETKDAITEEPACKIPINGQTEKLDAMKQPVESFGEPGVCGTSSKKKKKSKQLSLEDAGDVTGSVQEPSDAKLEATKNEEELIDSKKRSGKKRKHKEDTSLVNGILNQVHNNSMTSPEKTQEAEGGEVVHNGNGEKHESGSTKTKKHKETPTNKKTPTGALAFKRVEVDKVSFADPRLSNNSYWAKDGAEEGYGAKAQEVLGLVRGRDFRHEKTKKKRGSYRGGLIGFESHSIKFENSDEDQGCGD